ncbi:uncharacterized protein Pyn_14453 [Prunus yedoensis var. nudiflora]|uniref:Uncharacterized protein n=1 Tax=Prunus yedoensis var. nudiflora TaxID=2094558 RepID=A0A314Z6T9_PRUYE|nr:uncharacterized protein Pyn_14453 [Prunus yedoensis var. nudiflora]
MLKFSIRVSWNMKNMKNVLGVFDFSCTERTRLVSRSDDGIISKYEEEKERLCTRYEQLSKQQNSFTPPYSEIEYTKIFWWVDVVSGKKERGLISEHEKACTDKIAKLEESLKKKKQDDRTFSVLRKTLGSFLESTSDEDILADD